MIPFSVILVIAVLLGVSLTELAKDLALFFIAIVVSFLIIALVVGLVIAVPNLLMWFFSAILVASGVIAAVEALNRCRRKAIEAFNRHRQKHLQYP